MTNKQVKDAFHQRKVAEGENLVSTGEVLLSYGWWEVARWVGDEIVSRKGKSYSPSTVKHRSGIKADREAFVATPIGQGGMNL